MILQHMLEATKCIFCNSFRNAKLECSFGFSNMSSTGTVVCTDFDSLLSALKQLAFITSPQFKPGKVCN